MASLPYPRSQNNSPTDGTDSHRSTGGVGSPTEFTEFTEQYLSDMHNENVFRGHDGVVYVIDCDIRINTPELKAGGTRTLTTEVEFIKE